MYVCMYVCICMYVCNNNVCYILLDTWVCLILNVLVAIIGAITISKAGGTQSQYLTTMGVSILYLVLFLPGSLFCWWFPLYIAYR